MVTDGDHTYDEHGVMYRIVKLLFCTPETNITLYVNYISIKKKKKKKVLCNFCKSCKSSVSFDGLPQLPIQKIYHYFLIHTLPYSQIDFLKTTKIQ